jgi:hypothetical protein
MTACVQSIHLNFGRVSMDAKHNVVHNNLWKSTRKPNVVVEDELDIRFTFNIWQQPAPTTETAHAKSTIHQVAKPTPFTWLPLLPLEAVPRLPPACPVVDTGIPLSSQTSEDDVDTIPKPASRRSSVTDIVKVEHGEPARKKQRVLAPVTSAVELGVLAERKDEVLSSPEVGNERSQALAIRRVRMRDVDLVEDFLVGHSGIKGVAIDPVANTAWPHCRTSICLNSGRVFHCESISVALASRHWPFNHIQGITTHRNVKQTPRSTFPHLTNHYPFWRS